MVDTDPHPAGIGGNVVDPGRVDLPEFGVFQVVHVYRCRLNAKVAPAATLLVRARRIVTA